MTGSGVLLQCALSAVKRYIKEKMEKTNLMICGIPSILWGIPSDRLYIYIHGKMSRKEYAESFAKIAEENGFQTLSFDLPQHGERTDDSYRCDVWNGITDLNIIADYAFANYSRISLFACSLGAYFALNTYAERKFEKCLFQSPIVDMEWLVKHMMLWSGVTEHRLEAEKEIETDIDLLRWDYYCYILSHPVKKWNISTAVLYGGKDNLQPQESIYDFAGRFGAKLTVSENSEHPFMAQTDVPIVEKWIRDNIS